MDIRNKYWIVSLSLLLSLSLALPFCCDALMMMDASAQHQQMDSHATHGQHSDADDGSCNCGHELAKDYQKTKKVTDSQIVSFSSAVALHDRVIFTVSTDFSAFLAIQPGILSDSGPPLHLLNSVFLN